MCWSSAKTGKAGEKEEKTLDGASMTGQGKRVNGEIGGRLNIFSPLSCVGLRLSAGFATAEESQPGVESSKRDAPGTKGDRRRRRRRRRQSPRRLAVRAIITALRYGCRPEERKTVGQVNASDRRSLTCGCVPEKVMTIGVR